MKRMSIVLDVLFVVLVLFIATVAFATQSGGQAAHSTTNTMGFKNYGQYVAAKHVSDKLNISTDTLRTEMVDNHLSLGDAIKKLRPGLSSRTIRAEVKNAQAAAKKAGAKAGLLEPIDHIPPRLSN